MEEIVKLIVENGTSVAVILYFMYRDNKFMTQIQELLGSLSTTLEDLKEYIFRKEG